MPVEVRASSLLPCGWAKVGHCPSKPEPRFAQGAVCGFSALGGSCARHLCKFFLETIGFTFLGSEI